MSSLAEADDLVRAAVAGDKVALGRLLLRLSRQLRPRLANEVPILLRRHVDCDDLLQQTFVRIVRDLHQLRDISANGFSCWASQVANHCLLDTLRIARAGKRRAGLVCDDIQLMEHAGHGSTPSRGARRNEIARALQVAVESLPGEQREAIAQVYLNQVSYASAADELGCSYNAVRSLAHRAKQRLRSAMGSPSDWI